MYPFQVVSPILDPALSLLAPAIFSTMFRLLQLARASPALVTDQTLSHIQIQSLPLLQVPQSNQPGSAGSLLLANTRRQRGLGCISKIKMRYQNWDVLLFPDQSKIPQQEFKTACQVIQDHGEHAHACFFTLSLLTLLPRGAEFANKPFIATYRYLIHPRFARWCKLSSLYTLLAKSRSQPLHSGYQEADGQDYV